MAADPDDEHRRLMREAIALEAEAQRAALDGDWDRARTGFSEAARRYRASWQAAPPAAYGRLVGMLKASIEAGGGVPEAHDALAETAAAPEDSAAAAYVRAVASVLVGDDDGARRRIEAMRGGSPAFGRAADGLTAIVASDEPALRAAVAAIVADFSARAPDEHLTGVAIADTALMLELLGRRRGVTVDEAGPLLPALPA